jgi:methylated-DNA-[protein]-cysteine S-methyltransferase
MGQRLESTASGARKSFGGSLVQATAILSIFPTGLGWFGLYGTGKKLSGLIIGHASADEVRRRMTSRHGGENTDPLTEADWNPELRRRLERFANGVRIDFDDCVLDWPELTTFQSCVVAATRAVKYGKTISYGELARRAGSPGAARAVGSVMANNRFPIIVPCHRVLAAGGKIGGFSAPQGISLKGRMLELESHGAAAEPPVKQNARQIRRKKRDAIAF